MESFEMGGGGGGVDESGKEELFKRLKVNLNSSDMTHTNMNVFVFLPYVDLLKFNF